MSAQSEDVGFLEHAENADEALEDVEEAREITADGQRQDREERVEEAAAEQSTQAWIESETGADTDTIPFRGREFEFAQPGLLHRKIFIQIAAENNPEEFADVDVEDEEAVEEALEETVTAEGLKSIDSLYGHTLRCLCDLVIDPDGHLDDTSNIGDDEMVLTSDELPVGAARWGQLPEDDETDEDGNIIKEGLGTLIKRTVTERGADEDDEGN